jgi:hypothetical protein
LHFYFLSDIIFYMGLPGGGGESLFSGRSPNLSERKEINMVTLRDVSIVCCTSRSSASKAMQGYLDISDSLRSRVRETAQVMGYIDRASARRLPEKPLFGLFITDRFRQLEEEEKIRAWEEKFTQLCEKAGYSVTYLCPERQSGEKLVFEYFVSRLSGACVLCGREESDLLYTLSLSTALWTACCGRTYLCCTDPCMIESFCDRQEEVWNWEDMAERSVRDLLKKAAWRKKRLRRLTRSGGICAEKSPDPS